MKALFLAGIALFSDTPSDESQDGDAEEDESDGVADAFRKSEVGVAREVAEQDCCGSPDEAACGVEDYETPVGHVG